MTCEMLMGITVVVQGASGRLGREIISGLCREPGIRVVGAVGGKARQVPYLALPDARG